MTEPCPSVCSSIRTRLWRRSDLSHAITVMFTRYAGTPRVLGGRSRAKRACALIVFAVILTQTSNLAKLTLEVTDGDDDMLADALERFVYGTVVGKFDTDLDGLMDGLEVKLGTSPRIPDTDGDGIEDGLEFMWGGDPLVPSPLLSYAIDEGVSRDVYRMLSPLERDGVVSEGEWALVRVVERILAGPPTELSRLYDEAEIRGCSSRIVDSILDDGAVDQDEEIALEAILDLPFTSLFDLCQSGILRRDRLSGDLDSDGFSNLEEIVAGTDPMNDLDNPRLDELYGRSERFLVVVQGGRVGAGGSLLLYHLAKRHGYTEDNILLIVSVLSMRTEQGLDATALYWTHLSRGWAGPFYVGMYMSDVPWGRRKRAPTAGLVYPDIMLESESDVARALEAISSLPSDPNDVVLVVINAHHGSGWTWMDLAPGNLTARDLSNSLSRLEYGRLVVLVNGCEAEDFARSLSGLRSAIVVATTSRGQLIDGEFARIFEFLAFAPSYPGYYLGEGGGRVGLLEALAFFRESVLRDEGYAYDPVWICLGCEEGMTWDPNPLRGAWFVWTGG